jgi:hypothetical protein
MHARRRHWALAAGLETARVVTIAACAGMWTYIIGAFLGLAS